MDVDPDRVAYIAYTGKAAQVLRNKGCQNAMTAHRLLYNSIPKKDGTFIHVPKDTIEEKYSIIIVDEISMLPKPMWELLLKHKRYIIACGDPGQLPPIGESTDVLNSPHIFLDEIMRQAADSEIIRLSADIRAGKTIKPMRGNEINIVRNCDLVDGMFTWADQIICGKNATRYNTNDYFRKMKWGANFSNPIVGDKIICLKNNWDKIAGAGEALVNGSIGTLTKITTSSDILLGTKAIIDFEPEGYEGQDVSFKDLLMDWQLITNHVPTINKENFRTFPKFLKPEQFDYGYCITCHKSQGSEYDKVLVLEEVLKSTDHKRWLYTACTRASQKLTLVQANNGWY